MADTEQTRAELLAIFADGQPSGSINPQDMRDYVVTADVVNTRFSTGLITGGIVTISLGDNTKVDISAGEGAYVDNFTDPLNPVRIRVAWSAFIAVDVPDLIPNTVTFFGLDLSSGTVTLSEIVRRAQEFTAEERRDFVTLAPAVHSGVTQIDNIGAVYSYVLDERQSLVDLADAIGQINLKGGNVYSANAGAPNNLTIDKSLGASFFMGVNYQNSKKTPNTTTDPVQSPVPVFFYTYQDGAGGFTNGAFTNNIDTGFQDNGTGTLLALPSNRFTLQRIFSFPLLNFTIIHYGQTAYNTLPLAVAAINTEVFNKNPVLSTGFRAWLIVKGGTVDLNAAIAAGEAAFIQAGKFGDILRP